MYYLHSSIFSLIVFFLKYVVCGKIGGENLLYFFAFFDALQ